MLYASETFLLNVENVERLGHNDNAMVRWICSERLADRVLTEKLMRRLGIKQLEVVRRERLYWHGYAQRMEQDRRTGQRYFYWKWKVVIPKVNQGRDGVIICWRTSEKEILTLLMFKIERVGERPLTNRSSVTNVPSLQCG